MTELIDHDEIADTGGAIDVFAASHPLRVGREHLTVPEGTSVQEIVERASIVPEIRSHALVYVGDRYVPQHMWPHVRPHRGTSVALRIVPEGGGSGDKNPLRTVLMIAVAAVATWVAGPAGSAWYWKAAGAAVAILGRMAVDEIAPLPRGEDDVDVDSDPRKFAVEGARNRPLRYEAIPRALGEIRWVPPYSAIPYTEVVNNDQYLRFAVCWGYGPLDINELRIGETPIENYDEVQVSHDYGDGNGWTNGNLVSQDVGEKSLSILLKEVDSWQQRTTEQNVDEISVDVTFAGGLVQFNDDGSKSATTVNLEIQYAEAGTGNWNIPDGSSLTFNARTVQTTTLPYRDPDENNTAAYTIYIDRYDGSLGIQVSTSWYSSFPPIPDAPPGTVALATLRINENNNITTGISNTSRPSSIFGSASDFQVSDNGTITGGREFSVTGGELLFVQLSTTASTTSTLRRSLSFKVPNGQYDVRLRRRTADNSDSAIRDEVSWTKLRSITHQEPVDPDFASENNIAQTAVRIKATDQLNGVIDRLNGITRSIVPDYDSETDTWVTRPTTNNASLAREILQDKANPEALPDSRLDLPAFEALHTRVESKGWSYGGVINGGNVEDALREVLSIARAKRSVVDGVWTVVSDDEKTTPAQHLTPKNSRNFTATKRFTRQPHALRVKFKNRDQGYQEDERVVYDDGFDETNATIFEDLDARGILTSDHAYSYGRYIMASNRFRPETYSIELDVEHLVATPGDLVLVQHDVPLFGIDSGRVKSVSTDGSGNIDGVTVDEELTLEAGKNYDIRFRTESGDSVVRGIDTSSLSLPTTVTTVTLDSIIDPANYDVKDGDLFSFGEETSETIEAIVQSIEEGNSRWDATLNLVDHAQPAIENAVSTIPSYDSQITEPQPFLRDLPPEPTVDRVASDEEALVREDDGTISVNIMVAFTVSSTNQRETIYVQGRFRKVDQDDDWAVQTIEESQGRIFLGSVNQGDKYRAEIRSLTNEGVASDWVVATTSHQVVGKTRVPVDVTGFTVNAARDRIQFEWDDNPELDVVAYEIREGGTWSSATKIGRIKGTEFQTRNVSNGPWLIKAIDSIGKESTNATSGSINVDLPESDGLRAQVIDNSVLLRWATTAGTFDLATHEVREGADVDTAEVIGNSDKTFDVLTELQGGDFNYHIVPIDTAGNEGVSTSIKVAVDDPPDFELRNQFQTDFQGFDGTTNLVPIARVPLPDRRSTRDLTGLQFDGVDDYVAIDKSYSTAGALSTLTVEAWVRIPIADGGGNSIINFDRSEYYRFAVGGNSVGDTAGGQIVFATTDDTSDSSSTGTHDQQTSLSEPINDGQWHHVAAVYDGTDKIIYLDGSEVDRASNPHNGVAIGTGTTRYGFLGDGSEATTFNGDRNDNFFKGFVSEVREWPNTVRTQSEIDTYKDRTLDGSETGLDLYYRMQGEGTAVDIETLPDKTPSRHDGTIIGATRYVPNARVVAPSEDLSRDELDAKGYNTRDDMIAAGLDYRAQPTPSSAKFIEVYDAGAVIPSTRVTVTLDQTDLAGSVGTTITISTKENIGDAWFDFPAGQAQVFATQFRWVKVTVDYDSDSNDDLARLNEVRTTLSTKLRTDSGTVTVSSNPTTVSFNVDFIDVNSITASPQGTTVKNAMVDFNDVSDPSGFDLYLFDADGNAATGDVRWVARGT